MFYFNIVFCSAVRALKLARWNKSDTSGSRGTLNMGQAFLKSLHRMCTTYILEQQYGRIKGSKHVTKMRKKNVIPIYNNFLIISIVLSLLHFFGSIGHLIKKTYSSMEYDPVLNGIIKSNSSTVLIICLSLAHMVNEWKANSGHAIYNPILKQIVLYYKVNN